MFHLKNCLKSKFLFNWNEFCKIISTTQLCKLHNNAISCKGNSVSNRPNQYIKKYNYERLDDKSNSKANILQLAALSFGFAYCQSFINNKLVEKKFFRAIQYGVQHEVKQYVVSYN